MSDRSDTAATVFVWGMWLFMTGMALLALVRCGQNIPLAEDWLLVAPFTGNEIDIRAWLWQQNNEHRIPVPKAILLGLLWLSHGDFRAGAAVNILMLALLSWAMIRVAEALRGGRLEFSDAFFPLVLLHWGHWENLLWGWQFTQVFPTVVAFFMLLLLVYFRDLTKPKAAISATVCLLMLPLSGANGLLYAPPLAVWLIFRGGLGWRMREAASTQRWPAMLLMGAGVCALGMTAVYFLGYERPAWLPPNLGIVPSLITAVQFNAFALGPVAKQFWGFTATAVLLLVVATAVLLLLALMRHSRAERYRALGLLVFLGSVVLYALAFGWGRSGTVALDNHWPLRYGLLAAPAVCITYFAWLLYGPERLQPVAANLLLTLALVFLPINTISGLQWNDWYQEGVAALTSDIHAGLPHRTLAERHQEFLVHWWPPDRLAAAMQRLQTAGVGPFAYVETIEMKPALPDTPEVPEVPFAARILGVDPILVTLEIRYYGQKATDVSLIWEIDGWQSVPRSWWTARTELQDDGRMRTPMVAAEDFFGATLRVPAGETFRYGFMVIEDSIWQHGAPVWYGFRTAEISAQDAAIDFRAGDAGFNTLSFLVKEFSRYWRVLIIFMIGVILIFVGSIVVPD